PHMIVHLLYLVFAFLRLTRATLLPYTTLFRSPDRPLRSCPQPQPHPAGSAASAACADFLPDQNHRCLPYAEPAGCRGFRGENSLDRKSTRLNSSHVKIPYADFCLKKKNKFNTT